MAAGTEQEQKWSDKKVECLRGRLLAERQASRTAKEDAEKMGDKLIELENKLREETKFRKKAEKKLQFLMKKLESLKINHVLEESDQSSSSENCAVSCKSSSSTATSGPQNPEEQEPKTELTTTTSMQSLEITLSQENSNSNSTGSSPDTSVKDSSLVNNCSDKSSPVCEHSKTDGNSFSSLKDDSREINQRNERDNEETAVDNTLALVPVSWPVSKTPSELKIVNKSVGEVLDALRHARERIQFSLERRHMSMIRVGPA